MRPRFVAPSDYATCEACGYEVYIDDLRPSPLTGEHLCEYCLAEEQED